MKTREIRISQEKIHFSKFNEIANSLSSGEKKSTETRLHPRAASMSKASHTLDQSPRAIKTQVRVYRTWLKSARKEREFVIPPRKKKSTALVTSSLARPKYRSERARGSSRSIKKRERKKRRETREFSRSANTRFSHDPPAGVSGFWPPRYLSHAVRQK